MEQPDPDLHALEAAGENRAVLAFLRGGAEPARSEYRLGPFEQHVHPDVCERLDGVARGGVLFAIAMGTGSIALRLPDGPARSAVLAHGGALEPGLGPEWVTADAWLSDVPRAEGTALLAAWVEAARSSAGA